MRSAEMIKLNLSTGKAEKTIDYVASEVPFQLTVNSNYSFLVWCSPTQLKELAVGYLLTEDIIKSVDEIQEILLDEDKYTCKIKLKDSINMEERLSGHAKIVSLIKKSTSPYQRDEKIQKVESKLKVKAEIILKSVTAMNTLAKGFVKTGGLHDSAIYKSDGSLVAFAEDIGRHNTVDKVIGMAALNKVDFSECFMAITGRVPGDMIYKAAKVGLPIVASMAAVTSSGIASAKKANIALVGFVRGERMNIYAGAERIIFQQQLSGD